LNQRQLAILAVFGTGPVGEIGSFYSAVCQYLLTRSQQTAPGQNLVPRGLAGESAGLSCIGSRRRVPSPARTRSERSMARHHSLRPDGDDLRDTRHGRTPLPSPVSRCPGPAAFQPRRIHPGCGVWSIRRRYHWDFIFTRACCRRDEGDRERGMNRPSVRSMTRQRNRYRGISCACVASRMWQMTCCRSVTFGCFAAKRADMPLADARPYLFRIASICCMIGGAAAKRFRSKTRRSRPWKCIPKSAWMPSACCRA